jgi:O-antigen ligase
VKSKISGIKFVLLCLIGFMLTFYIFYTPLCIVLFAIAWIAEGSLKRKATPFLKNKYALLFISLYLIYLAGMLYTSHTQQGWFDLQIKFSILLFPILLSSEGEMDFKKQKWFGFAFISGAVLHGLGCLIYAAWQHFSNGIAEFTYMHFSKFVHPTYYSMYIDLAFVFMYYALTSKGKELAKKEKLFIYISAPFLLLILVLLNSKMGQIVTALLVPILLLKYFLSKHSIFKAVATVVAVLGLLVVGIAKVSRFHAMSDIFFGKNRDVQSVESNQARLSVWQASVEVIKSNPIIGSGTGDAKYALLDQYQKDGMTGAYNETLNSHNQYLQTIVAVGIPGILILLANLFIPLALAIKQKRFVYTLLIVILCLNFLTESMLDQQAGTMFYGLFNSLLMFNFVI